MSTSSWVVTVQIALQLAVLGVQIWKVPKLAGPSQIGLWTIVSIGLILLIGGISMILQGKVS
jgi:hypothetical protein